MLSINDINLLQAQNEGFRKQNKELQGETKILKMSLNFANHTIKQLEKRIKRKNLKIEELKEKLKEARNGNKL